MNSKQSNPAPKSEAKGKQSKNKPGKVPPKELPEDLQEILREFDEARHSLRGILPSNTRPQRPPEI